MKEENSKTEITFKLDKSKTVVEVFRRDKRIGRIWSQYKYETSSIRYPYPHDDSIYCRNSIQICGFDKISQVWGCGPFPGKKDVVVHFFPIENEYYQRKAEQYADYVKRFFKTTIKTHPQPKFEYAETEPVKDIKKLKSFADWLGTEGA